MNEILNIQENNVYLRHSEAGSMLQQTPGSESSSGFSEKLVTSDLSCSDYFSASTDRAGYNMILIIFFLNNISYKSYSPTHNEKLTNYIFFKTFPKTRFEGTHCEQ